MKQAHRAQRLSASRIGHESEADDGPSKSLCSTPFGINGSVTRQSARKTPQLPVLNAFRHQRIGHSNRTPTTCFSFSAQRLSASTDRSPPGKWRRQPLPSAQTPFRHQRIGHRYVPASRTLHHSSAQRLSASTDRSRVWLPLADNLHVCSTLYRHHGSVTNC